MARTFEVGYDPMAVDDPANQKVTPNVTINMSQAISPQASCTLESSPDNDYSIYERVYQAARGKPIGPGSNNKAIKWLKKHYLELSREETNNNAAHICKIINNITMENRAVQICFSNGTSRTIKGLLALVGLAHFYQPIVITPSAPHSVIGVLHSIDLQDNASIYMPLKLTHRQFVRPDVPSRPTSPSTSPSLSLTRAAHFREEGERKPKKSARGSLNVSKDELLDIILNHIDYSVKLYYHDNVISGRMTNEDLKKQRLSLSSSRLPAHFWDDLAKYFISNHGVNPTIDGKAVRIRSLLLNYRWSDIWEEELKKIIDRAPVSILESMDVDYTIILPSPSEQQHDVNETFEALDEDGSTALETDSQEGELTESEELSEKDNNNIDNKEQEQDNEDFEMIVDDACIYQDLKDEQIIRNAIISEKLVKEKAFKTVCTSLHHALREDISYTFFCTHLEQQQRKCSKEISKIFEISNELTMMLVQGELARIYGDTNGPVDFKVESWIPSKFNKSQDNQSYSVWIPNSLIVNKLQKSKCLSYEYLSQASTVVLGRKNSKNKSNEWIAIMEKIKERVLVADIENFVHNQPFNDALINTTTAITKMWSQKRLNHDLRVVIRVLLRVRLCPERFSRYIDYRKSKKKAKDDGDNDDATSKNDQESSNAKNDRTWYSKNKFVCDELAEKLQSPNPNKQAIAYKLFQKLITSNNPSDNTSTTVSVGNTDQGDDLEDIEDLDFDDDDEDEQEHTNLLVESDGNNSSSLPITTESQNEKKESTSKTIRSLVAVITTMVKSPDTSNEVDVSDIKKLVYSSSTIGEHELTAAADIINLLRPYVPKAPKGQHPDCSMFTLAPLAFITNTVLRAVGLPKQAWQMGHKAEDVIALPLSARALYELFSDYYTIYHRDETPITSSGEAGRYQKETIGGFFDIQIIDKICKKHHLQPSWSMKFVNRYTIQWLGYKVISSSNTMSPTQSADTKRRQQKKSLNDNEKEQLQEEISKVKTEVNDLRKELKPANKKHTEACKERMTRRVAHNNSWKRIKSLRAAGVLPDSELFEIKETQWNALKDSKKKADECRDEAYNVSNELRYKNSQLYQLEKQLHGQSLPPPKPLVDKSLLKEFDIHDPKTFISSSDPGLVVTTCTIGTTSKQYLDVINNYKNLYTLLECEDTSYEMDIDEEEEANTDIPESSNIIVTQGQSPIPPLASSSALSLSLSSLLKHATNNTPQSMDSKTLSKKNRRKQERKKRKKEEISRDSLNRDQKTRSLLDTLAHKKLVAKIRREMVNGVKNAKVIHSFGAWKLRNSPIKGHRRRSSKKVQAAAKQCEHDKVIEVDEYLSSTVCPYCFQRLSNHIYRRNDKLVKVNGAKTCNNSHCPSRTTNSTTMTRDAVGAFNIGLITISSLLSTTGEAIFPFSRTSSKNIKYTRHDLDNIFNTAMPPSGSYCFF
ncbi:hypothetical protein BDC45DRAFT_594413 [Circinella umbellata]|nr:hypothetical protein BDC45DRAFT_594413 [Circinella umbellata]